MDRTTRTTRQCAEEMGVEYAAFQKMIDDGRLPAPPVTGRSRDWMPSDFEFAEGAYQLRKKLNLQEGGKRTADQQRAEAVFRRCLADLIAESSGESVHQQRHPADAIQAELARRGVSLKQADRLWIAVLRDLSDLALTSAFREPAKHGLLRENDQTASAGKMAWTARTFRANIGDSRYLNAALLQTSTKLNLQFQCFDHGQARDPSEMIMLRNDFAIDPTPPVHVAIGQDGRSPELLIGEPDAFYTTIAAMDAVGQTVWYVDLPPLHSA
ncbi:MAG: hypothetical protein AB7K09_11780 [Planctomycetota bacterium]